MEVELKPPDPLVQEKVVIVSISKENHHLLRLDLVDGNANELIEKANLIKKIISEEIKINTLNFNVHLEKETILVSFEEDKNMTYVKNYNFGAKKFT